MKIKTLIKKAKKLLNADQRKQQEQMASIKTILKKLKKRQLALKQKLQKETDEKSLRHIQKDLKIIIAQRKKGLRLIKKLKEK